jgi:hypothetical protein
MRRRQIFDLIYADAGTMLSGLIHRINSLNFEIKPHDLQTFLARLKPSHDKRCAFETSPRHMDRVDLSGLAAVHDEKQLREGRLSLRHGNKESATELKGSGLTIDFTIPVLDAFRLAAR